jgi:hypothetical protein
MQSGGFVQSESYRTHPRITATYDAIVGGFFLSLTRSFRKSTFRLRMCRF